MTNEIEKAFYNSYFPTEDDPGPKSFVYISPPQVINLPNNISDEKKNGMLNSIKGWVPKNTNWQSKADAAGCKMLRTSGIEYASEEPTGPDGLWDVTFTNTMQALKIYPKESPSPNSAELTAQIPKDDPSLVFAVDNMEWIISGWDYQTITVEALLQLEIDEAQVNLGANFCSGNGKYENINEDVATLTKDSILVLETITWFEKINQYEVSNKIAWPGYG